MTIAAGIQFNGGILLCADSQFSSPTIKFFDTKLTELNLEDARGESEPVNAVVAMSGTDGYMQMVVAKCESALSEWAWGEEDEDPTRVPVANAIESALLNIFQKHIYPHPHYGYTNGPSVELLIGVWRGGGNAELYSTNETSVFQVSFLDPLAFVGSGQDLARYATVPLIQPIFHDRGMTLDEAILLGTHALRVAKQNDVSCGGWSDFAVLYDDGTISRVAHTEIDATEHYSETFEQILRTLFFSVADVDSRLAKGAIELSNEQIAVIAKEQQKMIRERQKIAELLKPAPKA